MKLWRYGQPIELLGDRYRLEGMLGSGGMADVCLAYDEYEQRPVAIKVVKDEAAADQDMLNRFVKEAGQIVDFQHPHILRIYDQTRVELIKQPGGKDSMLFYIVMKYAAGGDLQKRMTPGEPYYSLTAAFTIMRQICGAVQYAHKNGIIHRDIKPLNILFRRPRTGPEEAVLSDFGLAVQIDASHHTFAEAGSFNYMAPEQFRGLAEPASDIFALGVMLYQLLTGSLPFSREMQDFSQIFAGQEPEPLPLSHINTALPSVLDGVIVQALDPDPAYRYRSAAEFWNAIVAGLESATLPSEQQPGQPKQPRGSANPLSPQPSVLRASQPRMSNLSNEGNEEGNTSQTRAAPKPLILRAYSLIGLANVYLEQERYSEAEPLYQQALSICEQQFGLEHPLIASTLTGLASLYHKQGKHPEAKQLYQRALGTYESMLGPDHPNTQTVQADYLAFLHEKE